jgi:hypothetical protein
MQINVSVTDVDLTSVVGEWAEYDVEGDYVGTGAKTLADAIAVQVAADLKRDDSYPGLKKKILDIRNEEIREQIKPIVAKAIEGNIQKTDEWGQPVGQSTSLHALIVKQVNDYLTSMVGDSYRGNRQTAVQKFVDDAVEKVVKRELAEAIAEEKAKVVAAVRAKAAELIATAVKEGVGR